MPTNRSRSPSNGKPKKRKPSRSPKPKRSERHDIGHSTAETKRHTKRRSVGEKTSRSVDNKKIMTTGSAYMVWKGRAKHTTGGLKKDDITRISTPQGYKYVSKLKSAAGKENKWILAVNKARAESGVKGFVPIKKGSPLYESAKAIYERSK